MLGAIFPVFRGLFGEQAPENISGDLNSNMVLVDVPDNTNETNKLISPCRYWDNIPCKLTTRNTINHYGDSTYTISPNKIERYAPINTERSKISSLYVINSTPEYIVFIDSKNKSILRGRNKVKYLGFDNNQVKLNVITKTGNVELLLSITPKLESTVVDFYINSDNILKSIHIGHKVNSIQYLSFKTPEIIIERDITTNNFRSIVKKIFPILGTVLAFSGGVGIYFFIRNNLALKDSGYSVNLLSALNNKSYSKVMLYKGLNVTSFGDDFSSLISNLFSNFNLRLNTSNPIKNISNINEEVVTNLSIVYEDLLSDTYTSVFVRDGLHNVKMLKNMTIGEIELEFNNIVHLLSSHSIEYSLVSEYILLGLAALYNLSCKLDKGAVISDSTKSIENFLRAHDASLDGFRLFLSIKIARFLISGDKSQYEKFKYISQQINGVYIPILESDYKNYIDNLNKNCLFMKSEFKYFYECKNISVLEYVQKVVYDKKSTYYVVTEKQINEARHMEPLNKSEADLAEALSRLSREDPKNWPGNRRRR